MTGRVFSGPSVFSALKLFAPPGAELSKARAGAPSLSIVKLTPYALSATVINALIFDALFWDGGRRGFLLTWTLLSGALLAAWALDWQRSGSHGLQTRASPLTVWQISLRAFAFALLWTTPILILSADATSAQRIVLVAAAGGMMAGGGMALATVWQASLAYAATLATPMMGILLAAHQPMLWGWAALAEAFAFVIAGAMLERAHLRPGDPSQVGSLLLKDFEENESNWLFEVDAAMRLTRVSERCAQMFGRDPNELEGQDVLSLIASPQYGSVRGGALQQLYRAFRRREAFRDVLLPISVAGERRWWSLTGRPVVDGSGAFLGFRGVGSDVTDAQRAEQSVELMANFDTVTGLPNRNYINQRLAVAAQRSVASGAGFAVTRLDLDRFRQVVDTLGHRTGDHLLRAVANRIRGVLEEGDTAARLDGGEFVILHDSLDRSAETAAATLAQKLGTRIGLPYDIDGQPVSVGASLGIAIAPRDGESAAQLLRNAELALSRAKADAKRRYRFFEPAMDAEMQARQKLELDLREALERGGLSVNFQPLIETSTGAIKASEALVRWNHKTLGPIAPAVFLPIAEESGLIVPLGEFVLRTACAEAASWSRDVSVAVNLSVSQFRGGDLTGLVKRVLQETGLPPERLDVEITQSMLIDDRETVLATLGELRAHGVSISLDDCGAGYSSIDYLSSFPFDKIKIDRTFVQDVAQRPDSAAIIRAIAARAATLGICTTAEGVETLEELDWLRAHGCGEAQGYLFSAAVPAEEFRLLLGMRSPLADKNVAA